MSNQFRLYEFDFIHAKDWVGARSKKEAIEFYASEIGEFKSELPNPKRLTVEETKNMNILDTEFYYGEDIPEGEDEDNFEGGYKIECTAFEALQKLTHPAIVGTTEY